MSAFNVSKVTLCHSIFQGGDCRVAISLSMSAENPVTCSSGFCELGLKIVYGLKLLYPAFITLVCLVLTSEDSTPLTAAVVLIRDWKKATVARMSAKLATIPIAMVAGELERFSCVRAMTWNSFQLVRRKQ